MRLFRKSLPSAGLLRQGFSAEEIMSDPGMVRRIARDSNRYEALIDGYVSWNWGPLSAMSRERLEQIGKEPFLGVIVRTGRLGEYIDALTALMFAEWKRENGL